MDQAGAEQPRSAAFAASWAVATSYLWLAGVVALALWAIATGCAPAEYRSAVALAGLNVIAIAFLAIRIFRTNALRLAPILAFLPGLALPWALPCIYFALFAPDMTYETLYTERRFLDGAQQIQLTLLVFILGYGALIWWFTSFKRLRPRLVSDWSRDVLSARIEWVLVLVGLISAAAPWMGTVAGVGKSAVFFFNAARNYFNGLPLIAGVRWTSLSRRQRVTLWVGLGINGLMYTLANARGYALWPVVMFGMGYFISPDVTVRRKQAVLLFAGILLPVYLVIGNQTRLSHMNEGFSELGERAERIGSSLTEHQVEFQYGGFLADFMGRLSLTGGQTVILENWARPELQGFDAMDFLGEVAEIFAPNFLLEHREDPRYTGNSRLKDYGFMINEDTSVEISLLGSLFGYFGLLSVVLGAMGAAAVHMTLCGWVGLRKMNTVLRMAFLTAAVSGTAWSYNLDLVTGTRVILWGMVYIFVMYVGVSRGVRLVASLPRTLR